MWPHTSQFAPIEFNLNFESANLIVALTQIINNHNIVAQSTPLLHDKCLFRVYVYDLFFFYQRSSVIHHICFTMFIHTYVYFNFVSLLPKKFKRGNLIFEQASETHYIVNGCQTCYITGTKVCWNKLNKLCNLSLTLPITK